MPTDAPGEHAPAPPIRPTAPVITASRGQVLITGAGFRPNCPVILRITYCGDEIVDYLTYISDAHGCISAALPETAIIETVQLAVTDRRPDPAGDSGLLWSNTVIVSPIGT
jgi:hypothetical protein